MCLDLAITICSIVERKVGVYKEIVEGDNKARLTTFKFLIEK